jgi:hypothetical protein
MKLKILMFRANIMYRLAKLTNRISSWFCNRHTTLYEEFKKEFEGDSK